jgi:hypothetical protein
LAIGRLAKEDGDACNGTLFCNKATQQCQLNPLTIVTCLSAGDTACQKNVCDKKSGTCKYQAVPDKSPCDDSNPCTQGEVCLAGECSATALADVCPCKSDGDCKGKDDGDLCNGVLYCDLKAAQCKPNPATVVTCQTVNDTACSKNACNPTTGQCAMKAVADKVPCDADGNPCTPVDQCKGGQCAPDTNVCVCETDAECAKKEDGDQCNGTLFCDKASKTCAVNPKSVVTCQTGLDTACSKTVCAKATGQCGKLAVADGTSCDADGLACTAADVCAGGVCKAGANVCGCLANGDCPDDGDVCNGQTMCDKSGPLWACKPIPNSAVMCPPSGACLLSKCDPASGKCTSTPATDGSACDDGALCTEGDVCKAGSCISGNAGCNDGNPCTFDVRDPKTGCTHSNSGDGQQCGGGSPCAGNPVCKSGQCLIKPLLVGSVVGKHPGADGARSLAIAGDGSKWFAGHAQGVGKPVGLGLGTIDANLTPKWVTIVQPKDGGVVLDAPVPLIALLGSGAGTNGGFVAAATRTLGGTSDVVSATFDAVGKETKQFVLVWGPALANDATLTGADVVTLLATKGTAAAPTTKGDLMVVPVNANAGPGVPKTVKLAQAAVGANIVAVPGQGYAATATLDTATGKTDVALVLLDKDGGKLAEKPFGKADASEVARTLTRMADGGFLLGGNTDAEEPQGSLWLPRTDATGKALWQMLEGSPNAVEELRAVAAHSDGGFTVAAMGNGASYGGGGVVLVGNLDATGSVSSLGAAHKLQGIDLSPRALAKDGNGFVLVGAAQGGTDGEAWVGRTDAWLSFECGTGACASNSLADCDDGNPCTDAGQCEQGTCGTGLATFGASTPTLSPPISGSWQFAGAAASLAHEVVAVEMLDGANKPKGDATEVVCLDTVGKTLGNASQSGLYRGVAVSGSTAFLATNPGGGGGQGLMGLFKLSELQMAKSVPVLMQIAALSALDKGGVAACGTKGGDAETMAVTALDSAGKPLFEGSFLPKNGATKSRAVACAGSPVGGVGVLQSSDLAGKEEQQFVRVSAQGVLVLTQALAGGGLHKTGAIAALDNGHFVVGRTDIVGGKKQMQLMRLDLAGKAVWSEALAIGAGGSQLVAMVQRHAGGFAALGYQPSANPPTLSLVGTASAGTILWSTTVPEFAGATATGMVRMPNGRFAIFGYSGVQPHIARRWLVGPWGDAKCADTPCAPLSASACDDQNPCTDALCQAQNGKCIHVGILDDSACGWAGACKSGQCADLCGNQQTDAGETCDDGNHINGDGCAASCQKE